MKPDEVAELKSALSKLRATTAYWKCQCVFLNNICAKHGVDLAPYYVDTTDDTEKPNETR
jgi:hypothetical protein